MRLKFIGSWGECLLEGGETTKHTGCTNQNTRKGGGGPGGPSHVFHV